MRIYRALLHLYPKSFRLEYGGELTGVFAARRQGSAGLWSRGLLLAGTIVDVAGSAAVVHLDLLAQDLTQALRMFRRSPGFVVTALAIIGLGIGASTAAFSVTDHVMFRPLPFPDSDRLVRVWETRQGYGQMELSPANFRDWQARQRSFAAFDVYTLRSANLTGEGDPVRLDGAAVGEGLFDVLGVAPERGRLFTEGDALSRGPSVVVLSHGLWVSRFGGSDAVIGRTVRLDGVAHEIIGVMPRTFAFPNREADYWRPLRLAGDDFVDRNNNYLNGVARLSAGVTVAAAQGDLDRIAAQLETEYPTDNAGAGASTYLMRDGYSSRSRSLVLALVGAAACLLVITCVNLVNLLLARVIGRRRELTVRAAMGAGRERLMRQLVTETLALALAGGALGVALAWLAVPLFARLTPTSLPLAGDPSVDWRVLGFAAAVTMATGLGTGLLPLVGAGRVSFETLREGGRAGGGARERLRGALVMTSIVSSVVLLVGAGLLLRAMWRVQSVDPGFAAEQVLTLRTSLPMPKYEDVDRRVRWYEEVLAGVRAHPGVENAAFISFLPMVMTGGIWPVIINGDELARMQGQVASLRFVTPGFFDVMSIPLQQGRDVNETDRADRPFVAVVSQSFAARYWPQQAAVGRRFSFAFAEREVVGVVGDIRVRGLESESEPQVYLPAGQVAPGAMTFYVPKELVIRTSGEAPGLVAAVRATVRQADPDQPISHVRWMTEVVAGETASRVLQIRVLASFAFAALLLAGVGIHGLLSFVVSQREREIGVRMALGARRQGILVWVIRRAAVLTGAGLAVGMVGAFWAGRSLEAALAGVPPTDLVTVLGVSGLVGACALLGAIQPAVRATRIDPVTAMRAE